MILRTSLSACEFYFSKKEIPQGRQLGALCSILSCNVRAYVSKLSEEIMMCRKWPSPEKETDDVERLGKFYDVMFL